MRISVTYFAFAFLLFQPVAYSIEHVIIIGIDGLGGEFISAQHQNTSITPNLDQMKSQSSWTVNAANVTPTKSGPNWAAMFSSADANTSGITDNDKSDDGVHFVPTLFYLWKLKNPNDRVLVYHDWANIRDLIEVDSDAVDDIQESFEDSTISDRLERLRKQSEVSTDRAVEAIKSTRKPKLMFVHLVVVDETGHECGWGSPQYKEAVRFADGLVRKIKTAVEDEGLSGETILFVSADHGGKGDTHGGDSANEREIPVFICGPSNVIRQNHQLTTSVTIKDIPATIAHMFSLQPPIEWQGKAITEAFTKNFLNTGHRSKVKFDAAVYFGNDLAYFFRGNKYVRFNLRKDCAASGYPKLINDSTWPGLEFPGTGLGNLDAAVFGTNGKVYFFKGNKYIRYDISSDCADAGYPKTINDDTWEGLKFSDGSRRVDAAFYTGAGKIYFFRGNEYIRFDIGDDEADFDDPRNITFETKGTWPGLRFSSTPTTIDAAFFSGTMSRKAYFFKGNQYIRYDLGDDCADEDYPRPITSSANGTWPGAMLHALDKTTADFSKMKISNGTSFKIVQ